MQSILIDSNVRWEFPGFRWLTATPLFNQWPHPEEAEAIDRDFAVHTPLWDWLFETVRVSKHRPHEYGLGVKKSVPSNWLLQFSIPFVVGDSKCSLAKRWRRRPRSPTDRFYQKFYGTRSATSAQPLYDL